MYLNTWRAKVRIINNYLYINNNDIEQSTTEQKHSITYCVQCACFLNWQTLNVHIIYRQIQYQLSYGLIHKHVHIMVLLFASMKVHICQYICMLLYDALSQLTFLGVMSVLLFQLIYVFKGHSFIHSFKSHSFIDY